MYFMSLISRSMLSSLLETENIRGLLPFSGVIVTVLSMNSISFQDNDDASSGIIAVSFRS